MTTIAYIAPFGETWGTEEHLARDAELLGIEVRRIPEGQAQAGSLDAEDFDDVDLVLYTKGAGLPPAANDLWEDLEAAGVPTASFHLDLYRGLARAGEILDDPFWRTGTVFTADGDPDTTAELAMLGIDHRWLPAACASYEAIQVDNPVFPAAEIVFVGSTHYHPEWPWRPTLLAACRRRYGHRFETLGSAGLVVRDLDLNRLYQQPGRIVVGDSLALPGHRNYWSDRYYETIGRGGFLVAPRVSGLEQHFQNGGHFIGYDVGDIAGLYGIIDAYLDNPLAQRQIAEAGQRHVQQHHTYRHRIVELLAGVGIYHELTLP